MAWDKTKPQNDMLLINFPPACRANWDAIELGTDPNLQITNAKVAPGAGIEDTKLAQIVTANKVLACATSVNKCIYLFDSPIVTCNGKSFALHIENDIFTHDR